MCFIYIYKIRMMKPLASALSGALNGDYRSGEMVGAI
jgi:hypothetical protein